MSIPTLRLQSGRSARLRAGSPWIFSNELESAQKSIEPGSVVRIANERGHALGLFHYNPNSLIAARRLSGNCERPIDQDWLDERLRRALELRNHLFDQPGYRLVHGEADGLPGLIVDRYPSACVIQCNTAGMDRLSDMIADRLAAICDVGAILLRNDGPTRAHEGLKCETRWLLGEIAGPVEISENESRYLVSLENGQKTGWYFDQRANRCRLASLCRDRHVLDLFSFTGGFGFAAAAKGARRVLCADSSKPALELARDACRINRFAAQVDFEPGDAFAILTSLAADKQKFDVVSADPPPFARSKKDVASAQKAYQKLARMCAQLANEGGYLALACCSHNIRTENFQSACIAGIRQAGRAASLLGAFGADLDHPTHPVLPETAYLRFLLFRLD